MTKNGIRVDKHISPFPPSHPLPVFPVCHPRRRPVIPIPNTQACDDGQRTPRRFAHHVGIRDEFHLSRKRRTIDACKKAFLFPFHTPDDPLVAIIRANTEKRRLYDSKTKDQSPHPHPPRNLEEAATMVSARHSVCFISDPPAHHSMSCPESRIRQAARANPQIVLLGT